MKLTRSASVNVATEPTLLEATERSNAMGPSSRGARILPRLGSDGKPRSLAAMRPCLPPRRTGMRRTRSSISFLPTSTGGQKKKGCHAAYTVCVWRDVLGLRLHPERRIGRRDNVRRSPLVGRISFCEDHQH